MHFLIQGNIEKMGTYDELAEHIHKNLKHEAGEEEVPEVKSPLRERQISVQSVVSIVDSF